MNWIKKCLFTICFSLCLFTVTMQGQPKLEKEIQGSKLSITPTGRLAMDVAVYDEDKTTLSNGAAFSDIRLGFDVFYKKWSATIDMGFANNKLSPKDIFLQYKINNNSHLTAGHIPEPFGLDAMEGASNLRFFTGSASTEAFAPGRKIGIEYTYYNSYLWTSTGFFGDGEGMNGETEGDDGYAVTSRLIFNPLQNKGAIFHIGLAGSFRKADANGIDETTNKEKSKSIIYGSPLLTQVKKKDFLNAEITHADYQAKYAIELIAAYGPVALQGEYFYTNVKRKQDFTSYQASGAYAQISYILLGEKQTYASSVARLGRLRPKDLELVIRYNYTDLDCKHAEIFGGKISDWSLALNYQLNKYIAFKLNYSNIKLGKFTPLAAGERINLFQARALFVF